MKHLNVSNIVRVLLNQKHLSKSFLVKYTSLTSFFFVFTDVFNYIWSESFNLHIADTLTDYLQMFINICTCIFIQCRKPLHSYKFKMKI